MIIVVKNVDLILLRLPIILRILAALIEIHIGNLHHVSRVFFLVCQRGIYGQSETARMLVEVGVIRLVTPLYIGTVNSGWAGYLFTGYIVNAFESIKLASLAMMIICRSIFDGFGSLSPKRRRLLMNRVSRTPLVRVH